MKLRLVTDKDSLDAMWCSLCASMWYSYSGTGYANPDAPTQIANGVSTTTFSYDNDGNLVQKTVDGTTTTYLWDYANRLIALGVGGATTTYGYDAFGTRVLQTGTSTTYFYPFKWYSVASSTGTGAKYSTTTDYVFNGDTLVSTIDQQLASGVATGTAQTHFIHPDHLGSTNVVTNASGTVEQTLDYLPYGATRVSSGQNTEGRQYIGQFTDNSGLSYLNARYYNGSQGQFLSEDPVFLGDPRRQDLEDPQNLNSYSYSDDNPITGSDPLGKRVEIISRPIGDFYGIPLSNYGAHTFVEVIPDNAQTIGAIPGANTSQSFTLSGIPPWNSIVGPPLQKTVNNPADSFYAACGTICPAEASASVAPPAGVSSEQFDSDVVNSYNSLPNSVGSAYFFWGYPQIGTPNSNNFTSAVLTRAGVSQSTINQYEQTLQNTNGRITPGLGASATSPTYYQQALTAISNVVSAVGNYLNQLSQSSQSTQSSKSK